MDEGKETRHGQESVERHFRSNFAEQKIAANRAKKKIFKNSQFCAFSSRNMRIKECMLLD
jgi:hypothetical protein